MTIGNSSNMYRPEARRADTSSAGVEGPGYDHRETQKARRADTPERDPPNKTHVSALRASSLRPLPYRWLPPPAED